MLEICGLLKTNTDVLYEDGSWRQSVGASLFWRTPLGPLRFNFSDVLKRNTLIEMSLLT